MSRWGRGEPSETRWVWFALAAAVWGVVALGQFGTGNAVLGWADGVLAVWWAVLAVRDRRQWQGAVRARAAEQHPQDAG